MNNETTFAILFRAIELKINDLNLRNKLVLFCLLTLTISTLKSQTAANYTFAASSGTYTALSGATSVTVTGSASPGAVDDGKYNGIAIGFNFTFGSIIYTHIHVSTNGWLTLGTSAATNNIQNLNTGTQNGWI